MRGVTRGQDRRRWIAVVLSTGLCVGLTASAATIKKQFPTGPSPTFLLTNYAGTVTVKGTDKNQIELEAKFGSDAMELISMPGAQKVEVQAHALRDGLTPQQMRVDFEIRVPHNATVRVDSQTGEVTIEDLDGAATVNGISTEVSLSRVSGYITINTIDGNIRMQASHGHIKAESIGGELSFVEVNGPEVRATTTSGPIRYEGDFGEDGTYVLNTHSAPIEILPSATSSFDLTASAVEGVIESSLPFRPTPLGTPFRRRAPDKFLQGRFNGGDSTVEITSYSGTIRVQGPHPDAAATH